MAIDVDDLRAEVNATANDNDRLAKCVAVAAAILDEYLGDSKDDVPDVVYDTAWLAAGVDLFNQRQAPNGVLTVQSYSDDGSPTSTPIRVSTDPLRGVYALLGSWVGPAIG